jgi:hypothetical protein
MIQDDISFLDGEFFLEKLSHGYIADKAESLAIFTIGIGESYLFRDSSDFRFGKFANREK